MTEIQQLLQKKENADLKLLELREKAFQDDMEDARFGNVSSAQKDLNRKKIAWCCEKIGELSVEIKKRGYKVSTKIGPVIPLQAVNACGKTSTPDGLPKTVIGLYDYDPNTKTHYIYEEDTSFDVVSYNKVPIGETTLLFVTPQTRRNDIPIMEGDILFDPEAYRCVTIVRYDRDQKNFFADNYEISFPDNYEKTEVANLVLVNSVPLYEIDTTTSYVLGSLGELIPIPDIPYFPEHPFVLKDMVDEAQEILQSPNLNQPSQQL